MDCRVIKVERTEVPGGWIVGGPARLLDSWTKPLLTYWAPIFVYPAHELMFRIRTGASSRQTHNPAVSTKKEALHVPDSRIAFDARFDSTSNIAHILQNQIAPAIMGLESFGMRNRKKDLLFIVHPDTPKYALGLYSALGFETLSTADAVTSDTLLDMSPGKFPRRSLASATLRSHAVSIGLLGDGDSLGEDVFLARRDRRTLTNFAEVERALNQSGYRTIFAEDHPPQDQIRIIANSRAIFALHGAALAHTMFRSRKSEGVIAECFSCGYTSNWARAICAETRDTWLGGQGELNPDVLSTLLRSSGPPRPRAFESNNYCLNVTSVDTLIRMSRRATQCGYDTGPGEFLPDFERVTAVVKSDAHFRTAPNNGGPSRKMLNRLKRLYSQLFS